MEPAPTSPLPPFIVHLAERIEHQLAALEDDLQLLRDDHPADSDATPDDRLGDQPPPASSLRTGRWI